MGRVDSQQHLLKASFISLQVDTPWPERSHEHKRRICTFQQEKRQDAHTGHFLCPEHNDFENTETSRGNSCAQLLMKWCSQSSLGLWWHVRIPSQWQLLHRHPIPDGDSSSCTSPWGTQGQSHTRDSSSSPDEKGDVCDMAVPSSTALGHSYIW